MKNAPCSHNGAAVLSQQALPNSSRSSSAFQRRPAVSDESLKKRHEVSTTLRRGPWLQRHSDMDACTASPRWSKPYLQAKAGGAQGSVVSDEEQEEEQGEREEETSAGGAGGAALKRDARQQDRIRAEVSRRIRQLGKEGKLAAAVDAFTEMQVEGIAPDAMAATALIDCCIRCGELARAERAFHSLFSATGSLQPDAVAVAVLLRAYGNRKPVAWAKIQQLLTRLEGEYKMQPSVGVFNELIEICSRENDIEKGMELMEKMASVGVEPDGQTFEAVKRRRALRSHFKKVFA